MKQALTHSRALDEAPQASEKVQGGALGRGLKILGTLIQATRPLSATEVSQSCQLDVTTTQRLLRTLTASGYALRDEPTRRYLASPNVMFPVPLYHPWNLIRREATPALLALRDRLGLTTGVIAFPLRQRILLELAPGREPLAPDYRTGMSSPLHASGSGKTLLAALTPAERRSMLGPAPLKRFTPHTITDVDKLERDLAQGRERGYYLACDDYIVGFRVVAAPIVSVDRAVVGCFFAAGAAADLDGARLDEAGRIVKQSADLFSHASQSLRSHDDFVKACIA